MMYLLVPFHACSLAAVYYSFAQYSILPACRLVARKSNAFWGMAQRDNRRAPGSSADEMDERGAAAANNSDGGEPGGRMLLRTGYRGRPRWGKLELSCAVGVLDASAQASRAPEKPPRFIRIESCPGSRRFPNEQPYPHQSGRKERRPHRQTRANFFRRHAASF